MDYAKWIIEALERNPQLSRAGLARHLSRHRAVITMMLKGEREIKASELATISAYLGVPIPSASASAATIAIEGMIDRAWRDADDAVQARHAPIHPATTLPAVQQIAFLVDAEIGSFHSGDVLICQKNVIDSVVGSVVVRRERGGLVNFSLTVNGERLFQRGSERTTDVAAVVELRRDLRAR